MRILLLSVLVNGMIDCEEVGISSIAALLRENGHEVLLLSVSEDKIDYAKIESFRPDIIGFQVYDISKESVFRAASCFKAILPKVKICIGGYLATFCDIDIMLEVHFIDFAIRGEGELVFLNLLKYFEGEKSIDEVFGLTYREGTEVIRNKNQELIDNIDLLPFQSRDILKDNALASADISTSRGCSMICNFCCTPSFWTQDKIRWRGRNVNLVVDEIENIKNEYGVICFNFIDNSFEDPGINIKRVKEIAEEILNRNLQIYYTINLRAEFQRKATPALMQLMKKSGLFQAFVGIEAANEPDLKLYNKFANVEDNKRIIELLRNYDIFTRIGFMNFNPYTTFEGLRHNIDYLENYGFAGYFYNFSMYKAYKGSVLYNKIKSDGLLTDLDLNNHLGYMFSDSKIQNLANFITDLVEKNRKLYNDYYKYILVMSSLTQLRTKFVDTNNEKGAKAVLHTEEELKSLINSVNSLNASSFRSLIDLSEDSWNEKHAIQIVKNNISEEYLTKINMKIGALILKLKYKLDVISPETSKYVEKIFEL